MAERHLWLKNAVSTVKYLESLNVEHCMKIIASQLKDAVLAAFFYVQKTPPYPRWARPS